MGECVPSAGMTSVRASPYQSKTISVKGPAYELNLVKSGGMANTRFLGPKVRNTPERASLASSGVMLSCLDPLA